MPTAIILLKINHRKPWSTRTNREEILTKPEPPVVRSVGQRADITA